MGSHLVTVASFRDLPQALLAKGALESTGIPCFLANENIVRLDWLLAGAVGGIRLQVPEAAAEKAVQILNDGIPAVIFSETGELYQQPQCPNCDSLNISYQDRNRWVTFLSWLMLSFPLPFPKELRWVCQKCGYEWEVDETADDPMGGAQRTAG